MSRPNPSPQYRTSDFDFDLPDGQIAQIPLDDRASSRLLHVDNDALHDRQFRDLPDCLAPGDLLIVNDARVIRARLHGQRETGGRLEVLIERILDEHIVWAQLRASKKPRPGNRIWIDVPSTRVSSASSATRFGATAIGRAGEFFVLKFDAEIQQVLDEAGELPLPPYITRPPEANDDTRYQTVFAKCPGAVAAPTAGLHFDSALLQRLVERGIRIAGLTLHVGAGTFQPVRVENLDDHEMHAETYEIPQSTVDAITKTKQAGHQVIAVGTTALRALESSARTHGAVTAGANETRLFLKPGDAFEVVDRLITNFHLPRSTLMMLVCAFAGYAPIHRAYQHAIAQGYRFFSYGDAMLLDRAMLNTTALITALADPT
jgi:S-adenosylmethionine:tRNA ribosyltransferase-isomerase